jgi:hypothetical protein
MAKLQNNFDAQKHEPLGAKEAIPAGWYKAIITKSEWKQASSNAQNYFIAVEFTLVGGEHDGYVVEERINVVNTNATAVEIANKTLCSISLATQVYQFDDTQMLHGIPLMVLLSVRAGETKGDKTYAARNEIKNYKPVESEAPALPAFAAPPAAPQQPAPAAPQYAPAPQQQQAPAAAAPQAWQAPAAPQQQQAPAPQPAPPVANGGAKPPWAK